LPPAEVHGATEKLRGERSLSGISNGARAASPSPAPPSRRAVAAQPLVPM